MLKLGELVGFLRVDDSGMDQGLAQGESKFKGFGDKMGLMAAGIGAALGVGLGAALASALETDAAQTKLAAQLGSTEWAEELGTVAGNLYTRGFGASAEEGMQAVRAVMQSGLLPEDAESPVIEEMTRQVQALAQAWGVDVAAAARTAGQMMRNGLASDSQEAMDILTRGFQQTGDASGDLLDTFDEYSTQFRKLGLNGTEAMGLLSQGTKAGARDIDTVADSLKEFAIRAADGSKASAEGFAAIGLNAEKMTAIFAKGGPAARDGLGMVLEKIQAMKDPTEREAAAVALFGTKAEDMQAALMGMDLSKATAAMGDVSGATAEMADTFEESASQKMEAFKRQVQGALTEQLAKAIPYIEDTAKFLKENKDIVGPLAVALGVLGVAIGAIVAITKVYTAVQTALNVVMALNPIGLIVIAVIALIAGIYLLWTNSSAFRDFFIGMWDAIWGALVAFWHWIEENAPKLLELLTWPYRMAWEAIKLVWQWIKDAAGATAKWIVDKFNAFVEFMSALPGRVWRAAKGMFDGVVNAAKSGINWIIRAWNAIDFSIDVRVPDWVPGIGGKGFYVADVVPDIPYLAKGGTAIQAGLSVVGDAGPELAYMPTGASVVPLNGDTLGGMFGGRGGAVRVFGELLVRGDGLLSGMREYVRINGGSVEDVIGAGSVGV